MSNEKRRKLGPTSLLPSSISYNHFISLVLLLLVTLTSQTTLTEYDCPAQCVCDETKFSAKCENIDALIESYSIKSHHHVARKNFMPIKSLDLSNNQLTKISSQLELLVNLTELNLSHNQLTQVHKLNLRDLETLDLSHNRITSAKLSKLPKNVVNLNLSFNEITYLPSDFMKLKKLRSLELTENPLNCSCDTLMIRNWITYQHVWSDKIIKCASPQMFKGQPWLQARQNEICIEALSTTTQQSRYNWDELEDNEVMMGDQPQPDADDENTEDEDDAPRALPLANEEVVEDVEYDTGDDEDQDVFDAKPESNNEKSDAAQNNEQPEIDENEEGFILISSSTETPNEHETPSETEVETENEGSGVEETSPENIAIEEESSGEGSGVPFGELPGHIPLGIFNDSTTTTSTTTETPLDPGVQRGAIVKEPETPVAPVDPTNTAKIEDDSATYILLAVIGILLVSLIAFVAMKNRKEKRDSKRKYDVEKNGATELQDMDKRLLGKPLDRNGNGKHEHSPLIQNDSPGAFEPYRTPAITVDEPIQEVPRKEKEKSQQSLVDTNLPNGNGNPNVFEPIEPVHTTNGPTKSPESEDEVFHPANDSLEAPIEAPKRYSPIYTPISPRSARYSPVYSPETGRVKIKLTETPKPKTPQVVTRSRSGAGDYVNTPNNQ